MNKTSVQEKKGFFPYASLSRHSTSGVSTGNFFPPIKLSAYADDIMVSISGQNEIDRLVYIVNSYGTFSSAKVNWAQTAACLVGQWKEVENGFARRNELVPVWFKIPWNLPGR